MHGKSSRVPAFVCEYGNFDVLFLNNDFVAAFDEWKTDGEVTFYVIIAFQYRRWQIVGRISSEIEKPLFPTTFSCV